MIIMIIIMIITKWPKLRSVRPRTTAMNQELAAVPQRSPRRDRLAVLTQTGPDTPRGQLLRNFWHPVALGEQVPKGKAIRLRILSEDLTLYRGQSGRAYLVGGTCAHRRTRLHTGW